MSPETPPSSRQIIGCSEEQTSLIIHPILFIWSVWLGGTMTFWREFWRNFSNTHDLNWNLLIP